MKQKVLAVGSHPDDVELGCGGTLIKHLENGDEVYVIIMTKGNNGDHSLNNEECYESLNFLGIEKENIFFGNFEDGELAHNKYSVGFIEKIINKLGITKVYVHSPDDRHQDHVNCSFAASSAARKVPEILLFEGPSTKVSFEPHYFVELTKDQLRKKLKTLKLYKSQVNKGSINLSLVKNLAKIHGIKNFSQYSEAFAVNHVLKKGKNV